MKTRLAVAALLVLGLAGCASSGQTRHYFVSSLRDLPVGITDRDFAERYSGRGAANVDLPIKRSSQRQMNGIVVEVWTMRLLRQGTSDVNEYRFLFVGGRLQRWGLPGDWQVPGAYDIDFAPAGATP